MGELTVGAAELACTVTPAEAALVHLPVAVALAVTTSPAESPLNPLLVHALEETVVVAAETELTKTSIVVPLASLLVPLTLVAPAQMGELTVGANDAVWTVMW